MKTLQAICLLWMLGASSVHAESGWLGVFSSDLRHVRKELQTKRHTLSALGEPMVGQTVPEFGVQHNMVATPPPESPWVQVDLGASQTFDHIALVPALVDFEAVSRTAYAFPRRFRLDASDNASFATFTPLFVNTDEDFIHSSIAPVVLATPGIKARYVRLTVTKLAEVEGRWTFALSELMVMQGNRNIAIDGKVTAIGSTGLPPRWLLQNLTDGRTPLGPPIDRSSVPEFDALFATTTTDGTPAWMGIDLSKVVAIDEVRLYPLHARQGADVPGFRFPLQYRVELSNDADFSSPTILFDANGQDFSNPGNNPVTLRTQGQKGRFVRVVMEKPQMPTAIDMAIAELEIYSGNVNVAHQGKAMSSGDRRRDVPRPLALLNDGHASYGRILELPIWLDQWEQRRVLEKQIGNLAGEETRLGLMAQQRAWYSLCFALGAIGVGIVLLMAQARRRRAHELEGLRQQLARDLHDEIGSNLAGIARLSEVAASSSSGEAAQDWQEVRRIASESTDAMREVLWLVGARQEAGMELMKSLKQVANRMLVGKEVIWREWCEVPSADLPMESRRHVFLFFKEALANIVRHSNAKRVELASKIRDHQLELNLSDNGCGFDMTTAIAGTGLASLRERAKSLNGSFVLTSAPNRGTTIALHIPLN